MRKRTMLRSIRIAKPILLVSTPVGVAWGLYEAWRVGWWRTALMVAMLTVLGAFSAMTVRRILAERRT
ncbi:MAG: hypothetical protein ACKO9D_13005, partial [Gammaproteobacteria bacterium]